MRIAGYCRIDSTLIFMLGVEESQDFVAVQNHGIHHIFSTKDEELQNHGYQSGHLVSISRRAKVPAAES